jgi:hypothetical protein
MMIDVDGERGEGRGVRGWFFEKDVSREVRVLGC